MALDAPLADQLAGQVTHYATTAIVDPANITNVVDILNNGFANVTTPRSTILVDYAYLGEKSNSDTAFGWRGMNMITVWAFWTVIPSCSMLL